MSQRGNSFDFLGYSFMRSKRTGKVTKFPRVKSQKNLRGKIKPLTKRTRGWNVVRVIERINPILRGYYGYFKHTTEAYLESVDGWVRARLRGILRTQGNRRGRARGRDHQKWPNSYFAKLGLFSLKDARAEEQLSLRRGAKC